MNTQNTTNAVTETAFKMIKIVSTHKTLDEAVAAAKVDLSYNVDEALSYMQLLQPNIAEAYVCDDGKVRYVYLCNIKILHEFDPFIHCMSDSPFQIAMIANGFIILTGKYVRKDKAGRKWFAQFRNTEGAASGFLAAL